MALFDFNHLRTLLTNSPFISLCAIPVYRSSQVRNPIAVAMAACSFLKTEINKEPQPLADEGSMSRAREDVVIIDTSLSFINDLLRSMLDMHRAADKQMQLDLAPIDMLHDVLEPVAAMLHNRQCDGGILDIQVNCPEGLCILGDCLRLKQVRNLRTSGCVNLLCG